MSKYFYGKPNDEIYQFEDYDDCATHIADEIEKDDDFLIMVEVMISKKSGERYCMEYKAFTNYKGCGKKWCDEYKPRNGKNGICKHQSWGCIETGREWKVFPDGSYKKISGRKK